MDLPLVSVIIPTCNSSNTLEACLKSVKAQTYPIRETIVVDNYSSDRTSEIAESYGAEIFLRGPERSAQMNYGVSKSRGEYFIRIDSDMIMDADVIEKCLRLCHRGTEAVILPVLPHPNNLDSFWVNCRMLEQKMLLDDMFNVAPRFIKRSVFLSVGGYDETIVAWEDYDLHNRLIKSGCSVSLLQDAALWHLGEASSLREVVVRMIKYGKTGSLGLFTKKYGSMGLRQISILRPSFIRHRRNFLTDPQHYIGMLLLKLVQACSLMIGVLSEHLP